MTRSDDRVQAPSPAIAKRSRDGHDHKRGSRLFAFIRGQENIGSHNEKGHLPVALSLKCCMLSYAAAAGDIDLCAAWWMNFFITLAHITFLRTALSFTVRPWANMASSAFILNTRRMAASDWLML